MRGFLANARTTIAPRVELQGTYNRGRSLDVRRLADDVINGLALTPRDVDGLRYETLGGRASVTVAPRVWQRLGHPRPAILLERRGRFHAGCGHDGSPRDDRALVSLEVTVMQRFEHGFITRLGGMAMALSLGAAAPLSAQAVVAPSNGQAGTQMLRAAGMPLNDGALPPGSLTVRLVRGEFSNDLHAVPVELELEKGGTHRAVTGDKGRAEFMHLPIGATVRATAVVDGGRRQRRGAGRTPRGAPGSASLGGGRTAAAAPPLRRLGHFP